MELTPIRTRGKRRAASSGQAKRLAKRTRRNEAESSRSEKSPRQKPLSRLEQLPVEVLERIFIASENLVLPRCSRTLHHMLSGESVKQQLVIAAFAPTWDTWYGVPLKGVVSYHRWRADYDRLGGDPKFQSAVLACSWAKVETILSSYEIWIRRHAADRPFIRNLVEEEEDPLPQVPLTMRGEFLRVKEKFEGYAWDRHRFFQMDWFLLQRLQRLDLHPLARIPEALLAGPFDWDVADRLFWMFAAGLKWASARAPNWELTRAAFREIISPDIGDVRLARFILFVLLGAWQVHMHWPHHVVSEELGRVRALLGRVDTGHPANHAGDAYCLLEDLRDELTILDGAEW